MSFEGKYLKEVKLFDNQKNNVKKLVHRRRALLTDKTGTGKTVSILYAFAFLKEKQKLSNMLVLTPLSAYEKEVWKKDIQKFTTLKTIDLETFATRLEGHFDKIDVLLSQYDIIYGKHTHVKSLLSTITLLCKQSQMLLVLDEVHAFKSPNTTQTLALKSASCFVNNLWALTASPLSKNLEDTYNIINIVSPWYLGSFIEFRNTYCLVRNKVVGRQGSRLIKVQQIVGVKDEEKFKAKLDPLVITGESKLKLNYHYIDYTLSDSEMALYRRIAHGIDLDDSLSAEDWLQSVLSRSEINPHPIKDFDKYSSRFLYLQSASDGTLTLKGTQDNIYSTKIDLLISKLKEIISLGQSVLVYFDYYSALDAVSRRLVVEKLNAVVLESSGRHVLEDGDVTEAKVKQKPHILLCTKASSESVSYYFINNVVFFHVPTVPSVFVQFCGRITRLNTLFKDNLNCFIFRSNDIQLYKLLVVSSKAYQMSLVAGEEENIPPDYKKSMTKVDMIDKAKKLLLWLK